VIELKAFEGVKREGVSAPMIGMGVMRVGEIDDLRFLLL